MAAKKKPQTRKRGRPPKGPYSDKLKVISTRITGDLRKALDQECKKTGHSMSQEIEQRLRQSFAYQLRMEEIFGGPKNYALFRLIKTAMEFVEEVTGQCWHEDAYTHRECKQAISAVLKELRPKGRPESPSPWPFKDKDYPPNNLGKMTGLGAIQQVVDVDDKVAIGMGSIAKFIATMMSSRIYN